MRILIVTLLAFATSSLWAQDLSQRIESAYQTAKAGEKALNIFALNNSDRARLREAWDQAQKAAASLRGISAGQVSDPDKSKLSDSWAIVGRVFNEGALQLITASHLGLEQEGIPADTYSAYHAANAFRKALEFATKPSQTQAALEGLAGMHSSLQSMGLQAYDYEKNYEKAYNNFNEGLLIHDLLVANGFASPLNEAGALNDHRYLVALAALQAGKTAEAARQFQSLFDTGYPNPTIYEGLFNIYVDSNPEKASGYLQRGRQLFPKDASLLFAEINLFLRQNRLDELISKLEQAIQMEPENLNLYTALGSVYDNLYQREYQSGNAAQAAAYFDKALSWFNQALQKNPDNLDAHFSIGALYYNKAAQLTSEMVEMESDFSREGQQRYEAKKQEVLQVFERALPYFQKVESHAPNDINTLIALREIYARKDDYATSNEFKARLEKAQMGEKLDPYFRQ